MSYTMTHIYVAEKMLPFLPMVDDYETYLVGTLAPDAVCANPHFTNSMKERSHLFSEDLVWGQINTWEKANQWRKNIENFYANQKGKYDKNFLLGYVVHNLEDMYNSMYFYTPFMESLSENRDEKVRQYISEAHKMDNYLYTQFQKTRDLKSLLQKGKHLTIENVIHATEIDKRIEQIFLNELIHKDLGEINSHEICSLAETNRVINEAVEYVKECLLIH